MTTEQNLKSENNLSALETHPCFNAKARHLFGRAHLPVAPECNILCKFCDRKFDCVNETRPGVTSVLLSPKQALAYMKELVVRKPEISVVGIAGPGDPLANPEATFETLRLIREEYPSMLLCIATNGLMLHESIEELVKVKISHVTVTINALTPETGAKIYSWVRYKKRVYRGIEGASLLMENQLKAIPLLKKNGIIVKINSIVLPGINENEIPEIAGRVKDLGADIFNCMAFVPNPGSEFKDLQGPTADLMLKVRHAASGFLPIMAHCSRCRADATGLIGQGPLDEDIALLKKHSVGIPVPEKKYVAVATREGHLINQHLGEVRSLKIYEMNSGRLKLIGERETPEPGSGIERWKELSHILEDCSAVFVSGAGAAPRTILDINGIRLFETEGLITEVLGNYFSGKEIPRPMAHGCRRGAGCGGNGGGCG